MLRASLDDPSLMWTMTNPSAPTPTVPCIKNMRPLPRQRRLATPQGRRDQTDAEKREKIRTVWPARGQKDD